MKDFPKKNAPALWAQQSEHRAGGVHVVSNAVTAAITLSNNTQLVCDQEVLTPSHRQSTRHICTRWADSLGVLQIAHIRPHMYRIS